MKHKSSLFLSLAFCLTSMSAVGQETITTMAYSSGTTAGESRTDTIYYTKDWKVIDTPEFATYYRSAYYPANPALPHLFHTYYKSGKLHSEGQFISLGKNDDKDSQFEGEVVSYYETGHVMEKVNYRNGRIDGECTKFYDSKEPVNDMNKEGIIKEHIEIIDGMKNGLLAQFETDDGKTCRLTPYLADTEEGYYVKMDIDGNYSKYDLYSDRLQLETPVKDEAKSEYSNGIAWQYYNKNGIIIGVCNTIMKEVDSRLIGVYIINKSMEKVDLNPENVRIYTIKKDRERPFEILNEEEFEKKYKKITRKNDQAYEFRTIMMKVNDLENIFSVTNKTMTVREFQHEVISMKKLSGENRLRKGESEVKFINYLKRTTVQPGEKIFGYLFSDDKKVDNLHIHIVIDGIDYPYEFQFNKK